MHPLTEEGSELGDQISVISSEKQKKGGGLTHQLSDASRFASAGWHSDITFEPVPSDYAMLKIHTLPPTGGDTLWASGYEAYDRLSPPMQKMLEGLTATHDAKFFLQEAERLGNPLRKGIRGNPLNHGDGLTAVHPVIRTNRKSHSLLHTNIFHYTCTPVLCSLRTKLFRGIQCSVLAVADIIDPYHSSCYGLEIRLRQSRLHKTHQWHYQGRVRRDPWLSLQLGHAKP